MDRLTKILLALVAIPLWGLWLSRPAQSQDKPAKLVSAERIELTDPDGKVRMILDGALGGGVRMRDVNGKVRFSVGLYEDGRPDMTFTEGDGKVRLRMTRTPIGDMLIAAFDEAEGLRGGLVARKNGDALFSLTNKDAKERIGMSLLENVPRLYVADDLGQVRAGMSMLGSSPGFSVVDGNRKVRGSFGIDEAGRVGLDVFDANGRRRSSLGITGDSRTFISLVGSGGDPVFTHVEPAQ